MPIYTFKNPNKEEYIEVVQKMSEEHTYTDASGVQWQRVWEAPNASVDSVIDPDSPSQFVNKTKGWSVGECWDYSAELSQARKDKRGEDHLDRAHKIKKTKERKRKQALQRQIEAKKRQSK